MSHRKTLLIPFIILLYFFIHYIGDFWYFLQPLAILKIVIKYVAVVVLSLFVGIKLFHNKQRFLLFFSTLLFLFLFYGSFIDTGVALKLLQPINHISVMMILIFFAVSGMTALICFRLKESLLEPFLKFWAIYCIALMFYDASLFLFSSKPEKKYLTSPLVIETFIPVEKPAVFFLLFDMYPSDTILKKYLRFDNSANASFLASQGFFVSGNARSLYDETYNSIASTLNLQPLGFIGDDKIKDYKKPLIALKEIETALVPSMFVKAGYTFRNFSVFKIADQNSPLQFNLSYHLQNAFTGATFFNRCYDAFETDFFQINRGVDLNFLKTSWSEQVKTDLRFLDTSFNDLISKFPESTPSFNYFHFMIPHPPILYDGTGNELALKDRYAFSGFDTTNYHFIEYVKYGNKLIQSMVNNIFKKAGKNVVIIIQGDHGYREFPVKFPNAVRHGVMNAVYLPNNDYSGFSDTITVLSTFNKVLKNVFNYSSPNK